MTGFSSPVPVHTPLPRPNPTAQHHMPDDSKLSVAQTPESADLDPYAKLSPEAKNALERDMEDAARKYGTYIQEAMKKPGISDAERELMVNRYKNSYNTKQSMIRKKYGIRLRERRPRAMIEEDRKRLLGMYAGETTPAAKKSHTTDHSLAGSAMLGSKVDNAGHGSREALQAALTAKTSGGLTASAGTAAFTDPTIANKSAQARAAAQPRFSTSKVLSDVMQIDGESNYEDDESTDDDDIPAQLTGQKFSRA
ncbi:hypothetical protein CDD82_7036 [Ophiocordyceps australis]|uniref:Uncharacterized protein n=1 Tax=Ophiocordyceps australis TaxID=1399860 RepID=A0A2C5YSS9_9HYPO|nr:hypothetical protein CDD82_7036 [Ophiocordyceps australis]